MSGPLTALCTDFRPRWHLSPPAGRLNDPNGLFFSGERLHVFYQHDPVFPFAAKRTGWGHAVLEPGAPDAPGTPAALAPRHYPDALYPGRPFDRDGCYSGCAVRDDAGRVRLFYTGNRKDGAVRTPSVNQVFVCGADLPSGGAYLQDPKNPLISGVPQGYTGHVRDPYLTRLPGGGWLMLLGAQRVDKSAAIICYRSADLASWNYAGELELDTTNAEPGAAGVVVPGGFMWECPNLITLSDRADGQDYQLLVFCPQGLNELREPGEPCEPRTPGEQRVRKEPAVRHFASSDQCGYLVGRLIADAASPPRFEVLRGFRELDLGHEFYAPQVIELPVGGEEPAVDTPREGLLMGWMGLPAADASPSLAAGWAHTLTLPRVVGLRAGRLVQRPLFGAVPGDAADPARQCVRAELGADRDARLVLRDTAGAEALRIEWRAVVGTLSVTRSGPASPAGAAMAAERAAESAGRMTAETAPHAPVADPRPDTRTFRCPPGRLEVLVDACAIEIFAGDGTACASLSAWPSPGATWRHMEIASDNKRIIG